MTPLEFWRALDAKKQVGIVFWSLAGACLAFGLFGALAGRGDIGLAGFVGAAWFTVSALAPRDLFVKRG